ncbi:MAG: carboxypeptidase-like regulatory domain-containing protein [Chitinophagaceae bacterium]|nr:carboxypeptidase-like regulatory domain-containing protein [Chitinophagaceae bacterium]
MANDNNIKNFSAADIEKYHKGLLSNREMHELEKAALEDPFLADALEGYTVPGVHIMADMADLKKRLADRTEEEQTTVIPLGGTSKTGFPWFRAAAAVVILGGIGLLASQFLFNKKENDIAAVKTEKQATGSPDSAKLPGGDAITNGGTTTPTPVQNGLTNTEDKKTITTDGITATQGSTTTVTSSGNTTVPGKITDEVATSKVSPVVPNEPAKWSDAEKADKGVVVGRQETKDVDDVLKKQAPQTNGVVAAENKAKAIQETDISKERNMAANTRKAEESFYRNQRSNIFRGRVTDANNVGVPFANVTNVEDKVGTYADANGYFNLTSPDTALTVQVRSIGFENNQVQLRNTLPTNQVVMQDDRRNLSEVVISNQKPNVAALNRDANKTLQEPEPADGWANYNTYAANNLEIPEEIKTKQNNSSSVEVSFEVDKNGEPVNIRVEKSLCSKCDKEAIRLIKDGPKWKRNANKKGRTTVTINF